MSNQDVDIFLAHFGVKGMKWGLRNFRKSYNKGAMRNVQRNSNKARTERFKIAYGREPTSFKDKLVRDLDFAGSKKELRQRRNKDDRAFILGSLGLGVTLAAGMIAADQILKRNRTRRVSDLSGQ